ncbi:hypothetical protein AOCH_000365 [Aspergillus ochraceoroseus]|uniref:DASH complex subunit ASK1 n=1 Tax=Aspergillus ochraceoroseus TaxID=138278 RepID=A0A0F8UPE7_9EURO|nr:hypothetical protein AOCH_000365 [Aspergillus ochraceoroseus]
MSRPSSMAQRPLTLTEELEKLEQSITLTLQEIDHNFSRAHRIVTTSILPVVEQYAESSRDVWEGAKFWKQFFEASANVSLSGYEETPEQDTTAEEQTITTEDDSASISQSHLTETESYQTPSSEHLDLNRRPDDLDLTSLSLSSHSTPRVVHQERSHDDTTVTSSTAYPSLYQGMHQDIDQDHDHDHDTALYKYEDEDEDSYLPTTPGKPSSTRHQRHQQPYRNTDNLMSSSPFVPPVSTTKTLDQEGPIMHRLHDKTYRVQATPLGKGKGAGYYDPTRSKFTITTPKSTTTTNPKYAFEDSPLSSPEPEAPQLNSELFSSPLKPQTPNTGRKRRPMFSHRQSGYGKRSEWDSDDDDDNDAGFGDYDDEDEDELGPSPPKTMQFHIPQSRLMKTPAKEASRRIVEQLLYTAGANDTTEDFEDEQSPSVIRRVEQLEDDTF